MKKDLQDKATKSLKKAKGGAANSLDRKTTEIIGERWNELHIYSFSVNKAGKKGECTNQKEKEHQLNLAPSAISVSTPFAVSVMATNKGILEENNGVVFRTISISGTTGLYPLREVDQGSGSSLSGKFKSFAPKTAGAIDNLLKKASSTSSSKSDGNINLEQTGYYQFWALNNFLIEYAESKKAKDGKYKRLVFNCPKDNISYVVTPMSFDLRRSAEDPLLYHYSIQLKCWDVTTDKAVLDPNFNGIPSKDNIGAINGVLDRLRKSRNTMMAASNVLKAVQSDVGSVFNVYNQGVLRIKDIVGTSKEIQDMPDIIKNNAHTMYKNNQVPWGDITNDKMAKKKINAVSNPFTSDSSSKSSGKSAKLTADMNARGMSALNGSGPVTNLDGSTPAYINEEVNPEAIRIIYQIADDPTLSEGITIAQLGTLSRNMEEQIEKRIQESLALNSGDIRRQVEKLKEMNDNLAFNKGMMHPVYAQQYGLRIPTEAETKEPSEQDILLSAAIEEARDAYLTTLASGNIYDEGKPNPFGNANAALEEVDNIVTPISAYPVPVGRDTTLEEMAIKYLGDATRSREIVLLNELKSPYIDEKGFDLNIKNCSGRTFIVKDIQRLEISQPIRIVGHLLPTTRRKIVNIEDIGAGEFKITVDGSPDLNQYSGDKYPKLFARLPSTVGSGDVLLMPSGLPSDSQNITRSTPLSERLSYAEKVFKVDFALHPVTSDYVVSSSGDIARSYGYANAIQAIRLIIETERQELYLHPDYGIDLKIGKAVNTEIYKEITQRIKSAITRDPRFNNAVVEAKREGTAVRIKVEVVGSNGTGRIPLEFEMPL
jgi:hypothetical protein